VELQQLRCFVAVVEEGGFTRATSRLHRTQPAISYQIKQLEDELGQSLLHRKPRGIAPTEAGRVLLKHAREVFQTVRQAQQSIEGLSKGIAGDVRVGTVNSVGMFLLPDVLRDMRDKYPAVRPTILYRNSHEVLEALAANQVDAAVVANPPADRRLEAETILEEAISLVCSRSHPLCEAETVRPSDLTGVPFVSLTPESPTGELIRNYLTRMGVNVRPVVSTDNVETVRKMVEVGLGVALLPDMVTKDDIGCLGEPKGELCRIEVGPNLTRRIALLTWKQIKPSPAVNAFLEEIRAHCRRWKGCTDFHQLQRDRD